MMVSNIKTLVDIEHIVTKSNNEGWNSQASKWRQRRRLHFPDFSAHYSYKYGNIFTKSVCWCRAQPCLSDRVIKVTRMCIAVLDQAGTQEITITGESPIHDRPSRYGQPGLDQRMLSWVTCIVPRFAATPLGDRWVTVYVTLSGL